MDETIALHALRRRPAWLPAIRARIDEAFSMTARLARRATSGSSGSRRAAGSWASRGSARACPWTRMPSTGSCSRTTARSWGPGHWFEQPRTYFRLGYGWPTLAELREGLDAIDAALEATATG